MVSKWFTDAIGKFDQGRPTVKKAAAHVAVVSDIAGQVSATLAGVSKKPTWAHLNDAGKKAARREALANSFRDVTKAKLEIKRMREALQASKPTLPPVDKTDLVQAMFDQEARALVRSMPQEQRDAIGRSNLSPAVVAAVARGAPELSGVSPSVHSMLRDQMLAQAYPKELAAMETDAEALSIAEGALIEAEKELRSAGEFVGDSDFNSYVKNVTEPVLKEEAERRALEKRDNVDLSLEALFQRVRQAPATDRIKLMDRLMEMNVEDVYGKETADHLNKSRDAA